MKPNAKAGNTLYQRANVVFALAISYLKLLWCSPKAGVAQWVWYEFSMLGVAG